MARLAALILLAVVAAAGITAVGTASRDTGPASVTADGTGGGGTTTTSGSGANGGGPICPSCV